MNSLMMIPLYLGSNTDSLYWLAIIMLRAVGHIGPGWQKRAKGDEKTGGITCSTTHISVNVARTKRNIKPRKQLLVRV